MIILYCLMAYAVLVSLTFALARPRPRPELPPSPPLLLPGWLRPMSAGEPLVRLGRNHDGGYVLPVPVAAGADGLLSLGVNDDWSFERDFLRLGSRPVEAYDPTVGPAHFLGRGLAKLWYVSVGPFLSRNQRRLCVQSRPWATLLDYLRFFRGYARHHRLWVGSSDGPGAVSLDTALSSPGLARCRNILVKMDIEGAEYGSLAALSQESLRRIGCLAVEFHDVVDRLADLRRLAESLSADFAIRHVHANNYGAVKAGLPQVLEITWVRRLPGEVEVAGSELPLPGLDQPNRPGYPELPLRFAD